MGVIWQTAWQSTADEPIIYKKLIFRGNVARTGGAISDGSSENTYILLENVEAYENESTGGILYGQSGNYTLRNVYVHDNSGGNGTGVYSRGSNIVVQDSSLASERYLASFINGEDLDDILAALNTGGQFRISKKDKYIYLTK